VNDRREILDVESMLADSMSPRHDISQKDLSPSPLLVVTHEQSDHDHDHDAPSEDSPSPLPRLS